MVKTVFFFCHDVKNDNNLNKPHIDLYHKESLVHTTHTHNERTRRFFTKWKPAQYLSSQTSSNQTIIAFPVFAWYNTDGSIYSGCYKGVG